jgi:hypothetical protein
VRHIKEDCHDRPEALRLKAIGYAEGPVGGKPPTHVVLKSDKPDKLPIRLRLMVLVEGATIDQPLR